MCQTQHNLAKFVSIFSQYSKYESFTYSFDVSLSVKKDDDRNKHKLSMDYYYAYTDFILSNKKKVPTQRIHTHKLIFLDRQCAIFHQFLFSSLIRNN